MTQKGLSAHTPGPWSWWDSCSWRRLTSKDKDGRWMREGNVLLPIVASDGHPDLIVSPADRALIEAAPDMLSALKLAREVLWAGDFLDEYEAATAAIDKAEGRTALESIKGGE